MEKRTISKGDSTNDLVSQFKADQVQLNELENKVLIPCIIKKALSAPDLHFQSPKLFCKGDSSTVSIKSSHNKTFKGYIFGLLSTICICMSTVLIKMSPSLNSFNHVFVRYSIQLVIMSIFIQRSGDEFLGPKENRGILLLRGFTGCTSLVFTIFSLEYLDVSDVESIANCASIVTAILARIFLKEKLTLCHIFSIFLTIFGMILILRPTFLFGIETEIESIFHVNLTSNSLNSTNSVNRFTTSGFIRSVTGITFLCMSTLLTSISHIAIRKLCLIKIHFSVISIYPVIVGLPISITVSILLLIFQSKSQVNIVPLHFLFSSGAGLIATLGLILLNKAFAIESPAKVSMLRTFGVLFTFLLVACQTEKSNLVLLPCSHNCVCSECFKRIGRNCPVCRETIQSHFEMKD